MTTSGDWARLGKAIADRRFELDLSQEDLAERGGPSHQIVRNLERGLAADYRLTTFRKIDRALRWDDGTADRILAGHPAPQAEESSLRWAALAAAVRQRRAWLGLTQEQLAPRGGPSSRAVRDIEAGRLRPLTETTLAKLDRSLEWDHGTAQHTLHDRLVDEEPVLRWDNLGDAIRHRRTELRLAQELGTRGGPSEITVRKLERAEVTTIRGRTKTQIEHALQWPVGHVDRLLAGTPASGALSAPPEAPQAVESPRPMFPTVQSAVDDDARALRIGRLVLALIHELTQEPR